MLASYPGLPLQLFFFRSRGKNTCHLYNISQLLMSATVHIHSLHVIGSSRKQQIKNTACFWKCAMSSCFLEDPIKILPCFFIHIRNYSLLASFSSPAALRELESINFFILGLSLLLYTTSLPCKQSTLSDCFHL